MQSAEARRQSLFPRYPWGVPTAGKPHQLSAPPRRLGAANSVEDGGRDTQWNYPPRMFAALYWYLQGLQWSVSEGAEVSWVELVLDFEASTGVRLVTDNT